MYKETVVKKKTNNLTKNGQRIWIVTFSDKMANRCLKCCFTSQTRTLAKLQHRINPRFLTPTPPPLVGLTVPKSQKFWWGSQGTASLIFWWECKLLWLLWKTIQRLVPNKIITMLWILTCSTNPTYDHLSKRNGLSFSKRHQQCRSNCSAARIG